jgi:hypothetical protein
MLYLAAMVVPTQAVVVATVVLITAQADLESL